MTIPNCKLESWDVLGSLRVRVPPAFTLAVEGIITRCKKSHNSFVKVSIDTPFKPRTLKGSRHLHGHLQQLAVHFGCTMEEIKTAMKYDVPAWPSRTRRFGKRAFTIPESEANVSTIVEAQGVEWCHLIAGEEGIVLIEGKEEK